jgi:sulfatase maturation enzyme AslB (radical SAM superfamily)
MSTNPATNQRNTYSIELTTTALCNLGCTYCFEGVKTDKRRLDDKLDVIKAKIHEFLESDWFKSKYDALIISFWGGEPTLNNALVIDVIQEFQELDNVEFHIYTNAYNRKRLEDIIDNVNHHKLNIQISFDGVDISNKFRVTHSGRGSAATVLENMEYFAQKGVSLSLKSTIPLKAMDTVYKSWTDFHKLHEKFKLYPHVRVTYAPTIDYISDLPDQILPDSIKVFREQMLMVAKEEIKFYQENGYFLCTWFGAGDTKVHCSAGANIHAINVDGKGYVCHGAFYSPFAEEMLGSDVTSPTFVQDVIKMSERYQEPLGRVSDVCKGCVATTCMICPVSSFDLSKNEDHFDRWQDRWVNNMCGFFKAFGEIDRSVQKYLEKPLLLKTPTVINKDDVITV